MRKNKDFSMFVARASKRYKKRILKSVADKAIRYQRKVIRNSVVRDRDTDVLQIGK